MITRTATLTPGVTMVTVAPSDFIAFNHFFVQGADKLLLVHTGRSAWFEHTLKAAREALDVSQLDYIVFSHFEADEVSALNHWYKVAPRAQALVGQVGKASIDDFSERPCQLIKDGELIELGNRSLRVFETPHFPHGWDGCVYFDEFAQILFSSDFGAHGGLREPVTAEERTAEIIKFQDEFGFLAEGPDFQCALTRLAGLPIKYLATQHGSVLTGMGISNLFTGMARDLSTHPRPATHRHAECV